MASGTETAGIAAMTFGAVMAAKPLGVPVETLLLGIAFAFAGALGKLSLDLSRYFRGTKGLTLSGIFGAFAASVAGCIPASVAITSALPHLGVEADSWSAMGFFAMGYGGPELLFSLYGIASKYIQKRFNIGLPENGGANG